MGTPGLPGTIGNQGLQGVAEEIGTHSWAILPESFFDFSTYFDISYKIQVPDLILPMEAGYTYKVSADLYILLWMDSGAQGQVAAVPLGPVDEWGQMTPGPNFADMVLLTHTLVQESLDYDATYTPALIGAQTVFDLSSSATLPLAPTIPDGAIFMGKWRISGIIRAVASGSLSLICGVLGTMHDCGQGIYILPNSTISAFRRRS